VTKSVYKQPMRVVLLDFQLVIGTPIRGITLIWVSMGTFGLLRSTVMSLHGDCICFTIVQGSPQTFSVSLTVFLFVALGMIRICLGQTPDNTRFYHFHIYKALPPFPLSNKMLLNTIGKFNDK
jgi:hypothetical protein